ncbi:MAG: hypothetical protein HC923_08885 [Myxococcales bacterium]|nr:hypothetical protein [Myxococcales bacterium]
MIGMGVPAEAIFFAFLRLSAFFVVMPFPGRMVPAPVKVVVEPPSPRASRPMRPAPPASTG